ncbi:PepSY domain-containing protein [Anatilimnocola sp. NA78]|uniref:PepSY domain-containing protein n=1 Tax=Anatilimnocola sp. NA78 TaxID=3415683 RepID=UPI003CE54C16
MGDLPRQGSEFGRRLIASSSPPISYFRQRQPANRLSKRTAMSLYPKFRDVHLWVGLILLIPMALIAGTGVMLNHERLLGLKPTYEKKEKGDKVEKDKAEKAAKPKKSVSPTEFVAKPNSWQEHSADINLALAEGAKIWGDVPLERMELKNELGHGLLVKVKVHRDYMADGPEEIVWSVNEQAIVEKKGDPKAGMNWGKFVHDLHTGQVFSRSYGYFWSDVSGIAILALGLTGVVLYVIPLVKKAGKKKGAAKAGNPAVTAAALAKKANRPAPALPGNTAAATMPEPAPELTAS